MVMVEAAGIEPASNKDPIKASTDIFCFNTTAGEKQAKTRTIDPLGFSSKVNKRQIHQVISC